MSLWHSYLNHNIIIDSLVHHAYISLFTAFILSSTRDLINMQKRLYDRITYHLNESVWYNASKTRMLPKIIFGLKWKVITATVSQLNTFVKDSRYIAVQHNTILHTTHQLWRLNFANTSNSRTTPIPRPNGRGMGVFPELFGEKWPRDIRSALYLSIWQHCISIKGVWLNASSDDLFASVCRTCRQSGHYWDYYPGALSLSQVSVTQLKIGSRIISLRVPDLQMSSETWLHGRIPRLLSKMAARLHGPLQETSKYNDKHQRPTWCNLNSKPSNG